MNDGIELDGPSLTVFLDRIRCLGGCRIVQPSP